MRVFWSIFLWKLIYIHVSCCLCVFLHGIMNEDYKSFKVLPCTACSESFSFFHLSYIGDSSELAKSCQGGRSQLVTGNVWKLRGEVAKLGVFIKGSLEDTSELLRVEKRCDWERKETWCQLDVMSMRKWNQREVTAKVWSESKIAREMLRFTTETGAGGRERRSFRT